MSIIDGCDPADTGDRFAEAALERYRREVDAAQTVRALDAAQGRLMAALARARSRTHSASVPIAQRDTTDYRGERPRSTGPTGPDSGEPS